jgi:carbonic anhydrase/acetyltransferase-like protein (isoleucine patch superfamily)
MNSEITLCCKTAELTPGKVTFGGGCIVHPKARIIAEGDCNIIIGEYNIIEENVLIRAKPKYNPLTNNNETITVYIGNYNHFKIGAILENTSVDSYNLLDYKCKLEDALVESKCIITPKINIPKRTTIKTGSIVLDNQLIVSNTTFIESEFKNSIKDLYKLLSSLLPKQNTMHNIG